MDSFNIAVIELFHCCLVSFPVPAEVTTEMMANNMAAYFALPETDFHSAMQFSNLDQVSFYTIKWLANENFITILDHDDISYSITLTQKGLNAVNSVPTSLNCESKSFKETFLNGLTNMPFTVAANLMVEFFKSGN
jgi:hypothetical protein